MANVYRPGSRRDAGKLYSPLASLTTVTVMAAPLFLALTRTPSIAPSGSETTLPVRAALCACARAGGAIPADASRTIAITGKLNAHMGRSQHIRCSLYHSKHTLELNRRASWSVSNKLGLGMPHQA